MSKRKRTTPAVGHLRAYRRRGPDERGRYYYQVGYHEQRKLKTIPNASGWYDEDAITAHLAQLYASEAWKPAPQAPALAPETLGQLGYLWLLNQKARVRDTPGVGRGLSPNTYRTYKAMINRSLRSEYTNPQGTWSGGGFGDLPLARVSVSTIEPIYRWWLKEGSVGIANLALKVLGRSWRWGQSREWCAHGWPALRLERYQPQERHTPTAEQAEAVINALRVTQRTRWIRMAAEVLWATGARTGEVANLRGRDVDLKRQILRVNGKTGPRSVVINAHLTRLLAIWISEHEVRPDDLLWDRTPAGFRRVNAALARACEAADVPVFTAYGFRRLASTTLIAAGVDPKSYKAQMGHSMEIGLRWYAQVVEERHRAAGALLGRQSRGGEVIQLHARKGAE
jgi:integrase